MLKNDCLERFAMLYMVVTFGQDTSCQHLTDLRLLLMTFIENCLMYKEVKVCQLYMSTRIYILLKCCYVKQATLLELDCSILAIHMYSPSLHLYFSIVSLV